MSFDEPALRPPQEAHSLLLRATQGCTYNACAFCYVSRGYPFKFASEAELEKEIRGKAPFFPADAPIYLTGSNPFALPNAQLLSYFAAIRRHHPHFRGISMQSRIDDIKAKTDQELYELREHGLSQLYIGVENGSDAVLAQMNKGYTADCAVCELKRLDACGIRYTTFYVLGLGGAGQGKASAEATAALFNQVHPIRITTTGMTIFENTPVAEMVREGTFKEASEREKIEELGHFLSCLTVDTFYDGIHYLNPLNYRLATSDLRAKKEVLQDIRDILEQYSDEELELMVNRKTMHSL